MAQIPELDTEAIDVQTLYPDPDAFDADPVAVRSQKRSEVEAAVDGNSIVVLADDDLDGFGCATLLEAYHSGTNVGVVHAGHSDPPGVEAVLSMLAEAVEPAHKRVYICDLPPNDEGAYLDAVTQLSDHAEVQIFDHHSWPDHARTQIEDLGRINVGDSISGTEVTFGNVAGEWSDADSWGQFVTIVTDYDIGDPELDRSEDLADAAHQLDSETFRRYAREREEDLVEEPSIGEIVDEYQTTKRRQIELAKQRVRLHEEDGVTVVTTYGQCPSSQTSEDLFEAFDCDVVVLIQPDGELNIRTADGHPYSFTIADRMGGGGRERAAGATPEWYGEGADQIPWTDHWATMGEATRDRVVDVVARTVNDD
jgi:oligoribonuclease NrnB/cAMP/cGMP phosphodiesterase (DHH superfamily)